MTDNANPVVICAGADERFAIGLVVTLYSALVNMSPGEVSVYVMDMGLSERSRQRLVRVLTRVQPNVQVIWVHPDPARLAGIPAQQRPAYGRLLIPDFLPPSALKAIYLDSDLVIEGDLRKLWRMDLEDQMLLAAQDYAVPDFEACPGFKGQFERLGITPDTPYFNSGVMLLNVPEWHRQDVLGLVVANAPWTYTHLHFGDQDGLNVVLAGRWRRLDPRWNVAISLIEESWPVLKPELPDNIQTPAELLDSAFILHYTTMKPWRINYRRPPADRFHHYLKASRWLSPVQYAWYEVSRGTTQAFRRHVLSHISVDVKKRLWRKLARTLHWKWFR